VHRSFSKKGVPSTRDAQAGARRQRRQRPGLESLEGRQLLSLGNGFRVNTNPVDYEGTSANATNINGLSVVAWVDSFSPTNQIVYAQMLNADGSKRGPQITVEFNNQNHSSPKVAMDANGDFVVAYVEGRSIGQQHIVAKRFNSLGQPIGGRVANVDVADHQTHFDPSVAMDNAGNFVITYTTQPMNSIGIGVGQEQVVGRRFNSSGQFVRPILVDSFFNNNDDSQAMVASDHNGFIGIVFTKLVGGSVDHSEINLAEFGPDGTGFGVVTAISGFPRVSEPSIAVNDGDDVVIAYEFNNGSFGGLSSIGVQRFSYGSETQVGSPIVVKNNTGAFPSVPSVTLLTNGITDTGGPFVVAYNTGNAFGTPNNFGAEVVVFDSLQSDSAPLEVDKIFDADMLDSAPAVSSARTGDGKFLLTYTTSFDGNTNIVGREGQTFVAPAAKNLALTPTIQAGQLAHLTGQLTDAAGDANLTLTVNWGDGSLPQQTKPGLKPFDVTHKYRKPGVYKVHATWSDDHGLSNGRDLFITVKP
jgi:hypothetical protein